MIIVKVEFQEVSKPYKIRVQKNTKNIEVSRVYDSSDDSNIKTTDMIIIISLVTTQLYEIQVTIQKFFDMTENLDNFNAQNFYRIKQIISSLDKQERQDKIKKSKRRAKKFSNEEDQRLLNCVQRRGPKFISSQDNFQELLLIFQRIYTINNQDLLQIIYQKSINLDYQSQNHHLVFMLNWKILSIEKDIDQWYLSLFMNTFSRKPMISVIYPVSFSFSQFKLILEYKQTHGLFVPFRSVLIRIQNYSHQQINNILDKSSYQNYLFRTNIPNLN
ncbi:unnamed protein product (macronuclear) [Paramecium tetraurelia]|uniref:Uncharacterized protein n=1 Tax=Paramecium tetraurelia TaxID=5888 RepID=A0CPL2_PARTE|nr:uncharacterized protein GSPATT00009121001 [Paramecium tetraurelia]CAK72729.1 unnamed protein product [Paramecium tetraurelia]|eukprot:XP_001440126.1 hypothetical protein (macronuclear) [Paramecium tetraurelia strain d4-2]